MLFLKVLLILAPRIISAVHEHSVHNITWVSLRSEDGLIKYEAVLRFDVPSS